MYVCGHTPATDIWRSEDTLWKSALSFPHGGPKDQIQVIGLDTTAPNTLEFFKLFYSIYVSVLPACVSVQRLCTAPEEKHQSPGTEL